MAGGGLQINEDLVTLSTKRMCELWISIQTITKKNYTRGNWEFEHYKNWGEEGRKVIVLMFCFKEELFFKLNIKF